jgi:hypothetical protein
VTAVFLVTATSFGLPAKADEPATANAATMKAVLTIDMVKSPVCWLFGAKQPDVRYRGGARYSRINSLQCALTLRAEKITALLSCGVEARRLCAKKKRRPFGRRS